VSDERISTEYLYRDGYYFGSSYFHAPALGNKPKSYPFTPNFYFIYETPSTMACIFSKLFSRTSATFGKKVEREKKVLTALPQLPLRIVKFAREH